MNRRFSFANNQIYHVYNRGVEKRDIFIGDKNYLRFLTGLIEFNDTKPATGAYQIGTDDYPTDPTEVRLRSRESLVDILAFCLMPNHYHLLIQQLRDNGITMFLRKLGTGYTNFFNIKHKRVGPLFQGKFRAVLIEREAHLIYLPCYIHTNPLDLIPKTRRHEDALAFLKSYRWSSLSYYLNQSKPKYLSRIINKQPLITHAGGIESFEVNLKEYINERSKKVEHVKDIILE